MKTIKTMMMIAFAMVFSVGFLSAQNTVDAANSAVTWKGYKVTGSHTGTINVKNGALEMKDGVLTGGTIVIDMTSITNTDMDGKMKGKLEGHLKSADFFSVEEFPTAELAIAKVISRGPVGEYKVIGNLTIKGITKEVKVNVSTKKGKLVADLTIDRSDFNVRYGSGSFFDNLGDKTIYDEFELSAVLAVK
jgi:polyisoprenoid-binding protein YceI